jgi:futalosine hydrolase
MKPVIVTAATSREINLLLPCLDGRERLNLRGCDAYGGVLKGRPAVIAVTGIGKVNTAAGVAALLERFDPEILINTGCAGAYRSSALAVGDLAIATMELSGDEGVLSTDGWHGMDLIGIPVVEKHGERFFNSYPLTRWGLDKAAYVAAETSVSLRSGPFVTVSTASGTTARGDELALRFGGICESMEGAAAAQVALIFGVDCLELRGISNLVEDRNLSRWNIDLAVERAQSFILRFVESLVMSY